MEHTSTGFICASDSVWKIEEDISSLISDYFGDPDLKTDVNFFKKVIFTWYNLPGTFDNTLLTLGQSKKGIHTKLLDNLLKFVRDDISLADFYQHTRVINEHKLNNTAKCYKQEMISGNSYDHMYPNYVTIENILYRVLMRPKGIEVALLAMWAVYNDDGTYWWQSGIDW